LTWLSCF